MSFGGWFSGGASRVTPRTSERTVVTSTCERCSTRWTWYAYRYARRYYYAVCAQCAADAHHRAQLADLAAGRTLH